jgi:hypothetical protein
VLHIDDSIGEGGGQILRTALALPMAPAGSATRDDVVLQVGKAGWYNHEYEYLR